ncbi:MAG: hypothetical protein AAFO82_18060 [Bacteroidota bacterium]
MTNEAGKVTVVNPELIVGIKHINVNINKEFSTTVYELNYDGNIIESKYKGTNAKTIASQAEQKGVKFTKIQEGQYFNKKHILEVEIFQTDRANYFNELIDKVSNNNYLKRANIKSRTGRIHLRGGYWLDVSKRNVPNIKKQFLKKGFTRKWLKGSWRSIVILPFVAIFSQNESKCKDETLISSIDNERIQSQFTYAKINILCDLCKEYNEIIKLESKDTPLYLVCDRFKFIDVLNDFNTGRMYDPFERNARKMLALVTPDSVSYKQKKTKSFGAFLVNDILSSSNSYNPRSNEIPFIAIDIDSISNFKHFILKTAADILEMSYDDQDNGVVLSYFR